MLSRLRSIETDGWSRRRARKAARLAPRGREERHARGKKLVVQMSETFYKGGEPASVETLDAIAVGRTARMALAPIMIYGDDVAHVVTVEGVAVAGARPVGLQTGRKRIAELRARGRPRHPPHRRQPQPLGRAPQRRPRGLVRGPLSTAAAVSELVTP